MTVRFTDNAPLIPGTRKTADGYLIAEAFVARTGIQAYRASEIGLVGDGIVHVYRPEDEVKSPASVRTYSHAPITDLHPDEMVNADNIRDLGRGEVSTEAEWVDGKLRLPLIVKDAALIAKIESGDARELSAGYTCALDHTPGVTPQGEMYDAVQREIRINHLAVVPAGRAGIAKIGDADTGKDRATWGASPHHLHADTEGSLMADTLQTVVLGDNAAQVAVADASKVEAYKATTTKALADAETRLADAEKAHKAEIEAKDEEIGTLKADLKKAQDAAPKAADLDKMVADRTALVSVVNKIDSTIKVEGVTDADLRKAAVAKVLGDEMVADASEAEISGMFKAVAKDAKGDTVADHLAANAPKKPVNMAELYAARDAKMQGAHKAKEA